MQLCQAEPVGILDNQGVDVRNINAGFNNCGTDQDLGLSVHNAVHDAGKFIFVHLPVCHCDAGVFQQLRQAVCSAVDVFDAVVQIIDLSASLQLAPDGVSNQAPVVLHDKGLHRQAVFRRFVDGGHIADTAQRHVHRTGNRRCGQCQHVDAV